MYLYYPDDDDDDAANDGAEDEEADNNGQDEVVGPRVRGAAGRQPNNNGAGNDAGDNNRPANNAPVARDIANRFLLGNRARGNEAGANNRPRPNAGVQRRDNVRARAQTIISTQATAAVTKIMKTVKKSNNRGIRMEAKLVKITETVNDTLELVEAMRDAMTGK